MDENVTRALLHACMRAMDRRFDRLDDGMAELTTITRETAMHMAAFMSAQNRQDAAIAALQLRLDRIERHLDLLERQGR